MPTIYFAGPLFTDAERAWNLTVTARLRAALPGITVLLPQEFGGGAANGGKPDYGVIYDACVSHLDHADAVVAVLDGADADSGTCWEVGYAVAKGKPVIGLRTDWRPGEDNGVNCMLSRSCRFLCRDVEAVIAALRSICRQ